MMQVNVFEAKTDFSKLMRLIESRVEDEITVARNGKPIVKIVLADELTQTKRIGVAKNKFTAPEDFDIDNDYIASMFEGGEL